MLRDPALLTTLTRQRLRKPRPQEDPQLVAGPSRAIGCDRAKLPHAAISLNRRQWCAEAGSNQRSAEDRSVQGVSALSVLRTERGTQDSNLESPVLET